MRSTAIVRHQRNDSAAPVRQLCRGFGDSCGVALCRAGCGSASDARNTLLTICSTARASTRAAHAARHSSVSAKASEAPSSFEAQTAEWRRYRSLHGRWRPAQRHLPSVRRQLSRHNGRLTEAVRRSWALDQNFYRRVLATSTEIGRSHDPFRTVAMDRSATTRCGANASPGRRACARYERDCRPTPCRILRASCRGWVP